MFENMENVFHVSHPLIEDKMAILRNKETISKDFRELVGEITTLMGHEATRDLPLEISEVETPMGLAKVKRISGKIPFIVPIWRAGDLMSSAMLRLMPTAKTGHVGVFRDEKTLDPQEYYCKFPNDAAERDAIILDIMLATGGSASYAIGLLKKAGIKNIILICLVTCKKGIEKIQNDHPGVKIYFAVIDEELLGNGYIFPGLGDAGDRGYGTK